MLILDKKTKYNRTVLINLKKNARLPFVCAKVFFYKLIINTKIWKGGQKNER